MKVRQVFLFLQFSLLATLSVGCCRSGDEVWDDTRTAGRHMSRGVKSAAGKHGDSRQVCSREDFLQCNDHYSANDFEFEPLPDQAYPQEIAMNDPQVRRTSSQPKHEPGMPSSHIPSIDGFTHAKDNPKYANTFINIEFPYNSSQIKGRENLETGRSIAKVMRDNPKMYLFIEGHCDERGAEAYNLALGARRSNSVRNFLIQEGVNPENIFTVSYGKERPIDLGHNESAWTKNRRAEFRTYER